jgi:hypothetical protein
MKQEFVVKAKNFALYKAFKEEVENLGYFYEQKFSEFKEKAIDNSSCLYFSDDFDINNPKVNSFAFSNPGGGEIEFELPQDWEEALEFAKSNFKIKEDNITKVKFSQVLEILADHFEVNVENIAIIE